MAAIAVGMFIGHWVIAPAISNGTPEHEPLRSSTLDRKLIEEAATRPDPSPYRTPTPAFDIANAPNHAAAAKQAAQAMYGGRGVADNTAMVSEPEAFGELREQTPAPQPSRARTSDRHTGVRY